jgi:hypothetical protein
MGDIGVEGSKIATVPWQSSKQMVYGLVEQSGA